MITRFKKTAQKTAFTALAGVSLLGFVTGCATSTDDSAASSTPAATLKATTEPTAAASTDAAEPAEAASTSAYTDGEYSAEGGYTSPGGPETVGVSLTLEGDVITAVTVTPEATNLNSKKYQTEFADGISAVVVGKSIDDIEVSKVAGSSLTSGGFNDAVDQIKADAAV